VTQSKETEGSRDNSRLQRPNLPGKLVCSDVDRDHESGKGEKDFPSAPSEDRPNTSQESRGCTWSKKKKGEGILLLTHRNRRILEEYRGGLELESTEENREEKKEEKENPHAENIIFRVADTRIEGGLVARFKKGDLVEGQQRKRRRESHQKFSLQSDCLHLASTGKIGRHLRPLGCVVSLGGAAGGGKT